MPTNTTNFNLVKPGQQEFYNVDVPNSNMDTIDGVLKALQDAINSGASEQDLTALRNALTAHLTVKSSVNEVGHVQLSNSITGTSETKAATEKAVSDAMADVKYWAKSKYPEGSLQTDPNTTDLSLILVQGHPNAPTGGIWYIMTNIYLPTNAKSQIAVSYNKDYGRGMYWRDSFAGIWQPWVKLLDESMKNVPGGYPSLDGNGKMTPSVMPTGAEVYELLYYAGFSSDPLSSVEVANLAGYKKLRVVAKGLYTADATIRPIRLLINGVPGETSYAYAGSQIANSAISNTSHVLPVLNMGGGMAAAATLDFIADIESELNSFPRYRSSTVSTAAPGNSYQVFGVYLQGNPRANSVVNTLSLILAGSVGGERLRAGTFEVWGVRR